MIEIDSKATVKNAKSLLKEYEHYDRLAKRSENQMSKEAKIIINAINETIEKMDNNLYEFILINRFIKKYKYIDVAKHIGLSNAQFFTRQNEALIVFAECYTLSDLIVGK
ncbi:ArpU family phage packaging/lysis transcriptional regulator [Pediococcus pentosaceus]|uniref:hypothetical protein n=1 Tax=Pediococcus pentosaceus TaxID=1255 RepID=UPI0018FE4ADD|nr:hypothetical protein [Pediococcus pentosaceus]MBF7122503.1 hypothetical protein [Pediococcus pentosaceus]MBF7131624.1 hypothetical protein [Pediococcus pentosaceus]MCS8563915.1 hypothetical protein [Pediococcus pentosaceus]MCS8568210.1 hypothetical protein [Pediococcus pentosaceus]MCS8580852.1 hypothetical protein [Pediococcus pentosaceus]